MRIAVTGGIAEGKTTVLQMIADHGVPTLSADDVAREVVGLPETQEKIRVAFGFVQQPSRDDLRTTIASDPDARRKLNAITHPLILREILDATAEGNWAIEVPLLIETCIQRFFDETWLVTCGEEGQLKRLIQRIGNEDEARRLIATQIPTRAKFAFADRIFRTDCDRPFVLRSVAAALEEIGL